MNLKNEDSQKEWEIPSADDLIEEISDGLAVVNPEGEMVEVNDSFLQLFALDENEIGDTKVQSLIFEGVEKFENFYFYSAKYLKEISNSKLKRAKEDPFNKKNNEKIILDELKKSFNINFKYLFLFADIMYQLPQASYSKDFKYMLNEFHDCVENEDEKIKKIYQVIDKITLRGSISPLAYSMNRKNI